MGRLKRKIALIIDGTSGIGLATATFEGRLDTRTGAIVSGMVSPHGMKFIAQ